MEAKTTLFAFCVAIILVIRETLISHLDGKHTFKIGIKRNIAYAKRVFKIIREKIKGRIKNGQ